VLPTSATNDRYAEFAEARASLFSRDAAAYIFISVCWIAAILFVNPIGEFPSVDDWAYLKSVQALVERGEILLSDRSAPNLITHLLWGALFAVPFGVSYTTLRISTLVAALLCAFALYKLLREAGAPVSLALFAALLLLFNPIFFSLSFTYMTDVPYVAAQTGAMLFLFLGLRSGSALSSAIGWLLALVAQFCRQTGLAIPFAWGGAYLVKNGLRLRTITLALWRSSPFLALQRGYEYWLEAAGRLPLQFGRQPESDVPLLTSRENIELHGLCLGLNRGEIRAKLDEIIALTELGPFLTCPCVFGGHVRAPRFRRFDLRRDGHSSD
jgi:hypothetical protein